MATYTSNYGWTKPSGSDNVDISVLNNNLDDQDSTIHDAFLNMAPPFSESSTYAVDDIVLYGTGLYKCHTAVVTPGSWTSSTNWQVYKLSEGGSGGGGGGLTLKTEHLTGLSTDANGCIYLDLALANAVLVSATTQDFSAMYGPFIAIGTYKVNNVYKYMLRFTDTAGSPKANSNYWVDIAYFEVE